MNLIATNILEPIKIEYSEKSMKICIIPNS